MEIRKQSDIDTLTGSRSVQGFSLVDRDLVVLISILILTADFAMNYLTFLFILIIHSLRRVFLTYNRTAER